MIVYFLFHLFKAGDTDILSLIETTAKLSGSSKKSQLFLTFLSQLFHKNLYSNTVYIYMLIRRGISELGII